MFSFCLWLLLHMGIMVDSCISSHMTGVCDSRACLFIGLANPAYILIRRKRQLVVRLEAAAVKQCHSWNFLSENVTSLSKKTTGRVRVLKPTFWSLGGRWKEMSSGGFASSAPSPGLKEVNTQQTKMHTHSYCGNKSQHMQNFSSFVAHLSFINHRLSLVSIWITNNERPTYRD